MAIKRLTIDGYGQLEINNCAFRRDGRVEAQCAPDATDFADVPVENGMLLAIDNVSRTVKFVKEENEMPVGLVYSAEHMYDTAKKGLKDFKLNGTNDFYPRLGILSVGDKFRTNTVSYDSAVDSGWTDDNTFLAALDTETLKGTPVYGSAAEDGSILCSATKPDNGPVLLAVAKTTMPNGTIGIKFQCIVD